MSLDSIRQISIREYLDKTGIKPARENQCKGMYHSPLREDKNASFSVDYIHNVWFDHGLGEGGSIIDLVSKLENCSIGEAISKLEKQYTGILPGPSSFRGNNTAANNRKDNEDSKVDKANPNEQAITILEILPLTHPSLLQYLNERCVNADVSKRHCKEIHYETNGKAYYAIGFKNDSGGYVLRNRYFKGCTSSDVTTHTSIDIGNKDACLVFEGFTDYLSFLTLKDLDSPKQDAVILNSVHNLSKALDFIKSHKQVYTHLDNDESGRKTTCSIKVNCTESQVIDQSVHYAKYKDLNEYLVSTKQAQKPVKKQSKLKPKR